MNLLVTDSRQFLPKEKRVVIEHREKLRKLKLRISVLLSICFLLVVGLIFFPGIIKKAPLLFPTYGIAHADPIIHASFKIQKINQKDLASVLASANIVDPAVASLSQLGELVVQPQVNMQSVTSADGRVVLLYKFLVSQGSPMSGSAATFIAVADQYKLDWRLLPGIADTESGLGRVIPIKADGTPSYNSFGYGVPGGGSFISFASWDEAIQTVGKSLAQNYGVANLSPYIMEPTYCPPCTRDHHWAKSVLTVMAEL